MMNKYRNVKIKIDGILFDSKKEAEMYRDLTLMEKAKVIKDLRLQPTFTLIPSFKNAGGISIRPIKYVADFLFTDCTTNRVRIIDCKGYQTEVYKLKKKLFDYMYKDRGWYIEETL